MSSGVYTITCVPTGKQYVGSSIDMLRRWDSHRRSLRKGTHKNVLLQRAWSKYGESAFEFAVLAHVSKEAMLDIEQHHLDSGNFVQPSGFNIAKSVSGIDEATRRKMSNSRTGKKHSEQVRAKLALANRTVPRKNAKQVQQIDSQGNVVQTWKSMNAAAKGIGRNMKNVWLAVNNSHLTCAGYYWKAVNSTNQENIYV